jgi:hypothetical protein
MILGLIDLKTHLPLHDMCDLSSIPGKSAENKNPFFLKGG